MKKAIFFDLDDTLLNDRKSIQRAFDVTCGELAEKYGLDSAELEANVRDCARKLYSTYPFFEFTQKIGINPFEGLWGRFTDVHHWKFREMGMLISDYQLKAWKEGLQLSGVPEEEAEGAKKKFQEVRRSTSFVFDDTYEVLEQLKTRGFRLLLLTNGSPSLQLEKLAMEKRLIPYFEHIVISGNFGFGKPDPRLFQHALRLMEISAKEAIMVGDNVSTDILGANNAGIDSIWIDHGDGKNMEGAKPTYRAERLKDVLDTTVLLPR